MSDSKQAIEVINAICEKVGIVCNSAQEFIPKLAQHNIVSSVYCMIVWFVFIVVGVLVIMYGKKMKRIEEESEYVDIESCFFFIIGGSGIVFLFSIFFLVELHDAIMWSMFPDVEAVTYILNAIGG